MTFRDSGARRVSLNIDLGELPGEPRELYELATVVNIACGGHAGDEATMRRALELAESSGARVSAHPSYPDRENFGRRSIELPVDELKASVARQVRTLRELGAERKMKVLGLKPHGALYHDVSVREELARMIVEIFMEELAAKEPEAVLIGPGTGALCALARDQKLPYLREGFADRGVDASGCLIPRGTKGALIEDPARAVARAVQLAESGEVETICVHGDTRGAVEIARAVRRALEERGLLRSSGTRR
ncbi:MAG: hypothetical protein B6A08_14250 [Sorangiineae bacterium NIC37A_2]|nr:MAG: hypothetical protein B6A08_14250 [Sorangiineae bacterium NIC37A_2]